MNNSSEGKLSLDKRLKVRNSFHIYIFYTFCPQVVNHLVGGFIFVFSEHPLANYRPRYVQTKLNRTKSHQGI